MTSSVKIKQNNILDCINTKHGKSSISKQSPRAIKSLFTNLK